MGADGVKCKEPVSEKGGDSRCVPWSILLDMDKSSKGSKFRNLKSDNDTRMASMNENLGQQKDESPGWLCEVNCALGSVQTESDALQQWYERWLKQSHQRNSPAKAAPLVSSAFPLKAPRPMLRDQRTYRHMSRHMFVFVKRNKLFIICQICGCCTSGVKGLDAPKQEWCRLSPKSKRAIQQWVTGLLSKTSICLRLLLNSIGERGER